MTANFIGEIFSGVIADEDLEEGDGASIFGNGRAAHGRAGRERKGMKDWREDVVK